MSLDFVAIDFETANREQASACSVGMARVKGGEVVARESFLIRPHRSLGPFSRGNMRIHGITEEMVSAPGVPEWQEALERILDFTGANQLVAHNARFDAGVLRAATTLAGLIVPTMVFACTVQIARRAFPGSANHKLPTVADYLGLGAFTHHDADEDALICARICVEAARALGHESLSAMMRAEGLSPVLVG